VYVESCRNLELEFSMESKKGIGLPQDARSAQKRIQSQENSSKKNNILVGASIGFATCSTLFVAERVCTKLTNRFGKQTVSLIKLALIFFTHFKVVPFISRYKPHVNKPIAGSIAMYVVARHAVKYKEIDASKKAFLALASIIMIGIVFASLKSKQAYRS